MRRKKDGADFVLQDVRMPDIDGIQILKSIRRPLPAAEPDCGHAAGINYGYAISITAFTHFPIPS